MQAAGRLPQASSPRPWRLAHGVQTLRADAAGGQVHDALERGIVAAVRDQAQVRQRILDFGALEEPQAAVDLVGNTCREERLFKHPRLRVRAVQDRDLAPRARRAAPSRGCDAVTNSASSRSLKAAYRRIGSPCAPLGPQVLAEPAGVMRDQPVGGRRVWCRWSGNSAPGETAARAGNRAGTGAGSRPARRASGRWTGRRRPPRTDSPSLPASSLIQPYWMALVSWNSSTSTCRKRWR